MQKILADILTAKQGSILAELERYKQEIGLLVKKYGKDSVLATLLAHFRKQNMEIFAEVLPCLPPEMQDEFLESLTVSEFVQFGACLRFHDIHQSNESAHRYEIRLLGERLHKVEGHRLRIAA